MWPVISFAGLTISSNLLAAVGSLLVGSELALRAITRLAPPEKQAGWSQAFNQAFWSAFLMGLAGARVSFALRFYRLYLDALQLLWSPRPGALDTGPGLVIAVIVFLLWVRRKRVPLAGAADASAVGAAGALAVLSLGRFATGAGYGSPTDVPWGVDLWGVQRHPVQLYEFGAAVLVAATLWQKLAGALPGELFWRFLLYASLSEFVLAAFRANPATWVLGIRVSQVVALALLLVALYALAFFAQMDKGAQAETAQNVRATDDSVASVRR